MLPWYKFVDLFRVSYFLFSKLQNFTIICDQTNLILGYLRIMLYYYYGITKPLWNMQISNSSGPPVIFSAIWIAFGLMVTVLVTGLAAGLLFKLTWRPVIHQITKKTPELYFHGKGCHSLLLTLILCAKKFSIIYALLCIYYFMLLILS